MGSTSFVWCALRHPALVSWNLKETGCGKHTNLPFIQIFIGGRQHQLDPVELIDFTCARIIVDGDNVGVRIASAEFFDDTLSDDMVRQAGKWLCADDVRSTAVNQFEHLSG